MLLITPQAHEELEPRPASHRHPPHYRCGALLALPLRRKLAFPPRLARGTRPSQSRVMSPSPRELKNPQRRRIVELLPELDGSLDE